MSRDPSELPIAIETRWFRAYRRNPFDDYNDYVDVITFADGTTEERHGIPNEWLPILHATLQRKNAERLAATDRALAAAAQSLEEVA
jgi:hypothetical protein